MRAILAERAKEFQQRRLAAAEKAAATRAKEEPATEAELVELLADLDMEAAAGTETIEEVIETMTEADLDSVDDEPPEPAAPASEPDDLLSDLDMNLGAGTEPSAITDLDGKPAPAPTIAAAPSDPEVSNEVTTNAACASIEVSNEVTASSPEVSNEVTSGTDRGPIKVSNEVKKLKRRSDRNDRQALEIIRSWAPASATPETRSFSVAPTLSISPPPSDALPITPKDTLTPTKSKRRSRKKRTIGSWDHTDDRAKLSRAATALEVWDNATCWSFNLTKPGRGAALAHKQGFIRYLSRALNRELKRRLGYVPHYFFSADITKQGRLHLHGGIRANADLLPVIEAAMKKCWGEWKGRGSVHQLDWNPQRCDDGWPDYFLQARDRVKELIGEHTYVITKELRRRAKFVHGEIRETCSPTTRLAA